MRKMSASTYIFRAVKHLIKMLVLVALIYFAMDATDTLAINQQELLGTRGIILLVALVLLSAAYPSYGFVERLTKGSIVEDRDIIVEMMLKAGYSLQGEREGRLTFRASGPLKRIINMGEDAVYFEQFNQEMLLIGGLRKAAVEAEFRLSGRIRIKYENQDNQA